MRLLEPFTTMLDLAGGALQPERKLVERTLGDMQGMFAAPVPAERLGELVYRVSEIPTPLEEGNLLSSTTTIEPGTVDGEYHMTKGHFHAKIDRAEIYVTLAGEGRLVMATEAGKADVQPMLRGSVSRHGVNVIAMPNRKVGLGSRRVKVTVSSSVASTLSMRFSAPKPSMTAP
jgi:glucose-6-phosphate isomerase